MLRGHASSAQFLRMKSTSKIPPLRVLVALAGKLESEAVASRISAAHGFVGLTDEADPAEVRIGYRCGRESPLPSLTLSKLGMPGIETAVCECCRSISRNTSWELLLDACIAAANRNPRTPRPLAVLGPRHELGKLTRRELEVLRLVGHGKSIAECAEALGVAPSTIGNHKYRLMRKLDVRNSLQLLRIALRHGLAEID